MASACKTPTLSRLAVSVSRGSAARLVTGSAGRSIATTAAASREWVGVRLAAHDKDAFTVLGLTSHVPRRFTDQAFSGCFSAVSRGDGSDLRSPSRDRPRAAQMFIPLARRERAV